MNKEKTSQKWNVKVQQIYQQRAAADSKWTWASLSLERRQSGEDSILSYLTVMKGGDLASIC